MGRDDITTGCQRSSVRSASSTANGDQAFPAAYRQGDERHWSRTASASTFIAGRAHCPVLTHPQQVTDAIAKFAEEI